ncbi:hypothetical protein AGMMS49938_16120 [Fibrobacterales bacterium]|nr:hypothetical protein AGMMS49938_16120 [Fibrobacterales bacterium]
MFSKNFNFNEVDFAYEKPSEEKSILPLIYHDRSNLKIEKATQIINGFMKTDTVKSDSSAYGYFYIHYDYSKKQDPFIDLSEISSIMPIITVPFNVVFMIVGVPLKRNIYDMSAEIYLFDAKGNFIGIFEKKQHWKRYFGLYYGQTPIEEISDEYKKMFREILEEIGEDSSRMNGLLKAAGNLYESDKAAAYTEIYKIIKIK